MTTPATAVARRHRQQQVTRRATASLGRQQTRQRSTPRALPAPSPRQPAPRRAAAASYGFAPYRPPSAGRQQTRQRSRPGALRRALPTQSRSMPNYQAIVLAEFVTAIVLVATTPIATNKNKQGLSPYRPGDVMQLAAITLAFFLLSVLTIVNRGAGRFAAWFGLLILIAVGLGQAASIATTLDLFGAGQGGIEAGGQPLLPLLGKPPGNGQPAGIGNLPAPAGGIEAGGGPVLGG